MKTHFFKNFASSKQIVIFPINLGSISIKNISLLDEKRNTQCPPPKNLMIRDIHVSRNIREYYVIFVSELSTLIVEERCCPKGDICQKSDTEKFQTGIINYHSCIINDQFFIIEITNVDAITLF